jgi:hypothetical protein
MTEREKIFKKVEEFLDSKSGADDERKVIALLEKSSKVRAEILAFIEEYSAQATTEEEKEYVKTILDFLRLVDSERESELIERVIDLSLRRSAGVLKEKRNWLLQQLEESRKLGRLDVAL